MSGGYWDDLLSSIGVKPGDAAPASSSAPSAASSQAPPAAASSQFRQPAPSDGRPAGPNRAGYWREGSSYTRDREAAAAAAARPFTFKDAEGEWTRDNYREGYSAAQDGGGTWENARPGFSAGYMSVADPDVLLNAQRRINEPSIPVPKEPPGMKWKKIEGTPGPQSLEEAEWLQQAKEWRSGGQNTAEEDEERRAAAEERRQEAGRRAEEEWRRQQRANEASAAEARRQATRAEDEDLELQIALAVSASAASGDLNAQLRAELDLEEHRKAAGAQGEVGGRSRGQALAARYWISCCLGEDEELTADADGFYDLWGDYTEAEELEQGRCPTLRALLELDGGAPELRREALLVDRRSDIVLAELCETVKASLAGNEGKPLEVRAVYLAKTVARIMGGEAAPEQLPELQARWEAAASELRANGKGGVMRVGELPFGLQRHRALLFKALAPCMGIKCRLVKGAYYCGNDDEAKIVLPAPAGGTDMEVDLMAAKLRKSIAPQPSRPPPSHTQSMPSFHPGEGPASTSSQRSSDGSSRDGPSHASHASSAAGGGSSSFGPEPSMEEDVMAAELIQLYNVSLEDAYEAVLRADGDPKKMHVMCEACNILGLKVADIYDLLVMSGFQLQRAVEMAFDAAEDQSRADAASRERLARERRRTNEPPPQPQRPSQPYSSMPQARPPPASAPQRQPRAQPAAQPAAGAHSTSYSFNRPNVPSYSAERPGPQPARSASQFQARPGMTEAEARAQAQASERLREIREQARKDQKEAETADTIRRRFHQEWDKKVVAMDLPAILRAFGVPVPGGASPPAAAVRKAYRDALLRFHPDRQREKSLADRVRAEEMFKLITSKMEAYHGK